MPTPEVQRRRWLASQRITAALLTVWFVVTFGVSYFARELDGLVLGWPFSFWVASQGAPIVYLVLVCIYARLMHRLDDALGTTEPD
jgi:putative solute:sodium symporter small subunit